MKYPEYPKFRFNGDRSDVYMRQYAMIHGVSKEYVAWLIHDIRASVVYGAKTFEQFEELLKRLIERKGKEEK